MKRRDALSIVLLVIGLVMIIVGAYAFRFQIARVSIEDIQKNTKNYFQRSQDVNAANVIYTEFSIERIEFISDPDLVNTYYGVYLKDTFGYESGIVVSGDNVSRYQEFVGGTALFKVIVNLGPEWIESPYVLQTNFLARVELEQGYYGYFYYVYAVVVGPAPSNLLGQASTPIYLGGAALVVASLLLFTFQQISKVQKLEKQASQYESCRYRFS